jgi:hypothetical protein
MDPDDLERWNSAERKVHILEEQINKVNRELAQADIPKMKMEIANLFNQITVFVKKEDFSKLAEELRKLKNMVDDDRYELQNHKELISNL